MSFVNIPRPQKVILPTKEVTRKLSEIDIKLLNELLNLFTQDVISFYTNHDFSTPFPSEYWRPLNIFCDRWDDVTHEFVDGELESQRKVFYKEALTLGDVISQHTTPLDENFYSVRPRRGHFSESDIIRFRIEAKEINDQCVTFVNGCESFIRYAKKRLSAT